MKAYKEEYSIKSKEIISKELNKILDSLLHSFAQRQKILIMNLGLYGKSRQIPFNEIVKANIIRLVSREVIKKFGINPRKQKEIYDEIKLSVRRDIIEHIKKNDTAKEKIVKIEKSFKKFRPMYNIPKLIKKLPYHKKI